MLLLAIASCSDRFGPTDTGPDADTAADSAPEPPDTDGDQDDDGVREADGDCDDEDATSYPGATEVCDRADNDCDGEEDEDGADGESWWYLDADEDGWGDPDRGAFGCDPPTWFVADDEDCDDTDPAINPDGTESCNLADDDCDGETDEQGATGETTWYPDGDGDGWAVEGDATYFGCQPEAGYGALGDCDDGDATMYPGAPELCDGADQDCDGDPDDDDGQVTYQNIDGTLTDLTTQIDGSFYDAAILGDNSSYDVSITSGTVIFCRGTYYAKVVVGDAETDIAVIGRHGAAETTLTTAGVDGGSSGSVVVAASGTLYLQGLTVTGGEGSNGASQGGGVFVNDADGAQTEPNLTLEECLVTGNATEYGGGMVVYEEGWVSLVDTRVEANEAFVEGGGAWFNAAGRLDCEATGLGDAGFSANIAPIGGGITLSSSSEGSISTVGCDWGQGDEGDDNSEADIQQNPYDDDHTWCYGDAASLSATVTCASAACTSSTDTECP